MEGEKQRQVDEGIKPENDRKSMSIDKLIPAICTNFSHIVKCLDSDKDDINILMCRLAEHKNINHSKLPQYIKKELDCLTPGISESVKILEKMIKLLSNNRVRKEVVFDFYKGFQSFWVSSDQIQRDQSEYVTLEIRNEALQSQKQVQSCILTQFIRFFYEESYVEKQNKRLIREFWEMFNDKDYYRSLKFLKGFDLLKYIDQQLLMSKLVQEKCSLLNLDFFFSQSEQLKSTLAKKLEKRDPKLCGQFVKKYKLNEKDFPLMTWQLEKNALNYVIRENTYYFSEEKFRHDNRYLSYLALRLKDKQPAWAESLIVKYNLFDSQVFDWEGYRTEIQNIRNRMQTVKIYRNILTDRDDFGATELRVLGEPTDYLQLMDMKVSQNDVYFIDNINKQFEMCRQDLAKTEDIGFDCQFSGGWTKFNPPVLELIQLATIPRVYLLDFKKLCDRKQLKDLITDLYVNNPTNNMVGFGVNDDTAQISQYIGITRDKFKPVVDLQNLFKKQKTNISLKNLVFQKLGKPFSKYQQCSAWNARPLRRAQKHYAALDARVLLELLHLYRR